MGYLRGQVVGFIKGRVPFARAQTATMLASRSGVTDDEIDAILAPADLEWDPVARTVSRRSRSPH
jgi:hypothetical protein